MRAAEWIAKVNPRLPPAPPAAPETGKLWNACPGRPIIPSRLDTVGRCISAIDGKLRSSGEALSMPQYRTA
jgi:hypothetical protein